MCSPESELTVEPSCAATLSDEHLKAQYAIVRTLGQGSSAQVKLARHHLTGIPVAIKVLLKKKQWAYPIQSEVEILKMIDHPNIISLIQVIETKESIYMVQELAEGRELWDWIQQLGFMKENLSRKIFKQLLQATCYCHDRGIIHRDLKPDNIMVDTTGRVKIIDFGLGAVCRPGEKLSRFCGALRFGAPEFFLRKPYDGPKVDTWSLGIVLYFMTTGTLPFEGTTPQEIGHKVLLGKYHVPAHLSPELKDIIRCLLTVNPMERPALKNIMEHPWLQHGEDFTKSQCDKRVPSCLNKKILTAMACVGFNPRDIRESLRNKLYNEAMATYSLLQCQARQQGDSSSNFKPVHPGMTPFPSLEGPGNYPRCPKRRGHVPAPRIFRSLSLNMESPNDSQQTEQRFRNATVPAMSTSLQERTPSLDPVQVLTDQQHDTPDAVQSPRGRWKRWWRRIGASLRNLCCCFPVRKMIRKRFNNRVVPE